MSEKLVEAIKNLQAVMDTEGVDPRQGLPEELFLFATTLMPTANIDILVINEAREILLTWREENHHGKGWHIPGGCVRLQERLEERVQKTAIKELGTKVVFSPEPITVKQSMLDWQRPIRNQLERSHGISFLYACRLPDGYLLPKQYDGTQLKWFDHIPEDLLGVHRRLYGDVLEEWFKGTMQVPKIQMK